MQIYNIPFVQAILITVIHHTIVEDNNSLTISAKLLPLEVMLNQNRISMKKGCIISLVVAGIFIIVVFALIRTGVGMYNNMVSQREAVTNAWGNVETQYQRRNDLIPNFVNTVKGAANFEQQTLTAVIQARASATQVKIDPTNLNEQTMQQFQQAQGEVSSALSRLMVVVEKYPELKATQNFRDLQVELEGTENRISVARKNFNDVALVYNTYIKKFPHNILAGMFGFTEKPYFKAEAGSDKAPQVQF
jgi:LemA protein